MIKSNSNSPRKELSNLNQLRMESKKILK